ncbi:MAG: hypothetical protein PHQ58_13885 [Rhodoferax sp.]|uniref:hypothetical protein n=1 Tax=Rhodoferax sp. TaxID=50421 RepID=UPI002629B8C2|nr:hypothetical protein [Rhodoferax sp.]MDD2881516.1 hypothetical protein [Rhodoferax sp.]
MEQQTETNPASKFSGWDLARGNGRGGTGDWGAFDGNMERIQIAADGWKKQTQGASKLWLCWCVNDRWCQLQQRTVAELGFTPVVGWDPACTIDRPTILPGSIGIDFNAGLGYTAMWPHFPMEFTFLWADKVAFWHSDLLVRMSKLEKIGLIFDKLKQGEMAAVKSTGGLKNIFKFKQHRYWELIGCTTKEASQLQYDNGCGWWRPFRLHPNTPEDEKVFREEHNWDHGAGIMYWKRYFHGKVIDINERYVSEGHYSITSVKNYKKADSKSDEIDINFDLNACASKLGLSRFVY